MTGPIFEEGIPLHIATRALSDVQAILDKSYLVAVNKSRIQEKDRSDFYIRATRIQHGSLESLLEIVVEHVQVALPTILPSVDPTLIWTYTKQAYDLLVRLFTSTKAGEEISYEINGDQATVICGNQTYTYNAPVIQVAKNSVPSYRNLSELVSEKGVERATLSRHDAPERDVAFDLDKGRKDLFDVPSSIEEEAIDLRCEIFDYNKYERHGRANVLAGQDVPEGRYPFVVMGDQDQSNYIESMLRTEVILRCLREIKPVPLQETEIVKLHILSIISDIANR